MKQFLSIIIGPAADLNTKQILIMVYFAVCLFLLCGEPSGFIGTITYYAFVVANLANAARLMKKHIKINEDPEN